MDTIERKGCTMHGFLIALLLEPRQAIVLMWNTEDTVLSAAVDVFIKLL